MVHRPQTPQRAAGRSVAENDAAAVNRKQTNPTPRTPSTVKKPQAEGPYEQPEAEVGRLVAVLAARAAEEARRAGDKGSQGRAWEEEQALLQTALRLSEHHIAVLLPHSEHVCDFLAVTAASLRSDLVKRSLQLLRRLLSSLPSASPPRLASAALLGALSAACLKDTFLLEAALPCLREAVRLWPLRLLHHFAQPAQAAHKSAQLKLLSACILNTALAALCRSPVLPVSDCAFCTSEACAAGALAPSSSSSLTSLSAAELSQLLSQLRGAAEAGLAPTRRHSKQSIAGVFAALPAATVSAALKLLDYKEAEKLRRIAAAATAASSRPLPDTPAQLQQHVTLPASLPSSTPSQPLLTPARVQAFATMPEAEERRAMADEVSWLGLGEEGLVSPITSPAGGLLEAKAASSGEAGELEADGGRLQAVEDDDESEQVVRVHAARPLTPIPLDLSGGSQESDELGEQEEASAPTARTPPPPALSLAAASVLSASAAVQELRWPLVRPSLKRRRSPSPTPLLPPPASEPVLQLELQLEEPVETGDSETAVERLRLLTARIEAEMARGRRPTAEAALRLIELTDELRGQQTARSLQRAKGRELAFTQLMAAAQTA